MYFEVSQRIYSAPNRPSDYTSQLSITFLLLVLFSAMMGLRRFFRQPHANIGHRKSPWYGAIHSTEATRALHWSLEQVLKENTNDPTRETNGS